MRNFFLLSSLLLIISGCCTVKSTVSEKVELIGRVRAGMPVIDNNTAVYEVAVRDGMSHQDVVDSLKSIAEGKNFVNPVSLPIDEHIKKRGIDPQGVKEIYSFCNLSLGTDIFLDHPEFLVFANKKLKLFIGLARPTFDLKSIKNPSLRAQKAAQELETTLLEIIYKASRGDI